jgi:O-antigen/teichoic acid export membrane protein
MAVFGTVANLSLQVAVAKFVSEYVGAGKSDRVWGVLSTAIKLVAAVSIPGFILLTAFSQQLSEFVFGSTGDACLLTLAILASVVSSFGAIVVGVLWGLNLFREMVASNLVGIVTGRAVGILLAWTGLGLFGFIVGWVIGASVSLVVSIAYVRAHMKTPGDDVVARTLLAYSYPILFANLIALVQNWADVTILYAVTSSLVYAGIYYLGLAGAGILSPIAGSLTSAIFPTLSARFGGDETQAFKEALRVSQRVLNLLVIPVGFALAAVAGTAVTVAYGRSYLEAALPFAILTASSIIPAYQGLMTTTLQATRRTQPLMRISAAAAVTEVALTAMLVLPLSVAGSAVARLGMSTVAVVLTYMFVKGKWWPSMDRSSLGKSLVMSVLIGVVLLAFDTLAASTLQVTALIRLLIEGAIFLFVYTGALIILKPLHPQDMQILTTALPSNLRSLLRLVENWAVSSE